MMHPLFFCSRKILSLSYFLSMHHCCLSETQ